MDNTSLFGQALNQLGQTVKQTGKQFVKLPEEMVRDAGEQIKGVKSEENKAQKHWASDEERVKFLKDLYGKSDMSQDGVLDSNKNSNPSDKSASSVKSSADAKAMADKEEQKKLIELHNQLHKENYYDPTFNPVKKQEERPAEKVEQEKKKEMRDLQKKEAEKPPPLAVVREQNKAEMFRGAAG